MSTINTTESRKLWVEALRSGKYRQTQDYLKTVSSESVCHCCLGVACEVYQQHVGGLTETVEDDDEYRTFNGNSCVLPDEVQKWLNIDDCGRLVNDIETPGGVCGALTSLNDVGGYSFEKIADVIETQTLEPCKCEEDEQGDLEPCYF